MKKTIHTYGKICLCDIEDDVPRDWDVGGATNIRVQLPARPETVIEMQRRGYFWVDRTQGVTVNLARSNLNFEKLVRMRVEESDKYYNDVLRIALISFPYDRRFHILPDCDPDAAEMVLKTWVAELKHTLICFYKDEPVGFAEMKELSGESVFIHLAAVEERYRLAGAALSLYSKAAAIAREKGFKKLCGRISTMNTAAANLYGFLGASFEAPCDIFLKEKAHDT